MEALLDQLNRLDARSTTALLIGATVTVALLSSTLLKRVLNRLTRAGHVPVPMARRLHVMRASLIWFLATLLVLQEAGLFGQAWALASAILAALAVGFVATWSLLSNATSTLIILGLRPFRLGDRIDLVEPTNGTALGGTVVDLTLMYTTLDEVGANGELLGQLHIPNSLILQKLVRVHPYAGSGSESRETPFLRTTIPEDPP